MKICNECARPLWENRCLYCRGVKDGGSNKVSIEKVGEKLGEVLDKKIPTGHPQRYKVNKIYHEVIKALTK